MSTVDDVARVLRQRLVEEARFDVASTDPGVLRGRIAALLTEEALPLDDSERAALVDRVVSGTVGLGPLEPLMNDPEVDEIMVNGRGAVHVERRGRIVATDVSFGSDDELMHLIERILSPLGRRVDEAAPLADARLPDGSRVNCVIPPLSIDGPLLTIRRFRRHAFGSEDLVDNGTVTAEAVSFLRERVEGRSNIVVSGGTGSGKTTLLNVLSSFIERAERVITIEDAAELRLQQPHVLRLESRPPNVEGRGEVTIRQLVRNALRMRPDRIIVGEVRGAEALDMLQALNTGHAGSMTTVHSNSAADALRRIETLALMADVALPHVAIRQQLASAIDTVVHLERTSQGGRRVSEIAEVVRFASQVGVRSLYALEEGCLVRVALMSVAHLLGPSRPGRWRGGARRRGVVARLRGSGADKAGGSPHSSARRARRRTFAPLRRAASHGKDPSALERRRLRVAGALAGSAAGWIIGGGGAALAAGVAGTLLLPRVATWRRARYGRRVEAGAAGAALSMSGALAGGGSIRAALAAAAHELDGPIAIELRRTAVELEAGASLDGALDNLIARAPSRSMLLITAAVQLQRRSGGDLAALLRRIAASVEDEHRAAEEARTATAQARVTSMMVLALPPAGIAFAELASPGLVGRMLGSTIGVLPVIAAGGLQAVGAVAVRRLARIGP